MQGRVGGKDRKGGREGRKGRRSGSTGKRNGSSIRVWRNGRSEIISWLAEQCLSSKECNGCADFFDKNSAYLNNHAQLSRHI